MYSVPFHSDFMCAASSDATGRTNSSASFEKGGQINNLFTRLSLPLSMTALDPGFCSRNRSTYGPRSWKLIGSAISLRCPFWVGGKPVTQSYTESVDMRLRKDGRMDILVANPDPGGETGGGRACKKKAGKKFLDLVWYSGCLPSGCGAQGVKHVHPLENV
ncbi:hypothetical protein IV203_036517 [Nitzschia inconspicua]|uniref:Uncharacterized protein n=1 Tax=Nitzschia inconspicua TaxID=303405 RepID=A0A9K3LFY6_9STRA|nr:hypothetical protein IV203_036517 [Nitzschia inconspicua]